MKSLAYLNKYFIKYRLRFLLGIVFVTLSNLFGIIPAKLIQRSIDLVNEGNTPRVYNTILLLLLAYIGATLLKGFLLFLMRQTLIVMSRHIEFDLKNEIYAHYQHLSLSFYRKNNTGDLMARISEDVSRVRMYLGPAIMYSINLVVLFIFILGSMLMVNVKLTLFVLTPLPILSILIYKISETINIRSEKVQFHLSALSTYVQEAFSGIRVLKSFIRESSSVEAFDKECAVYRDRSMELVQVNAFFAPMIMLLMGFSTLLTVYIGGEDVIAHKMSIGHIAEFIVYLNMLTWPVAAVGWTTSLIQRAAASQRRINEFLDTQSEIISVSAEGPDISGKLEFENVSFVYPDSGIKALNDISFTIPAEGSLGIMGRTGSGKSTIANLIARLYDVSSGSVLIDEGKISKLPVHQLRKHIGYVPQDVFLFSDTIANNILFGLEHQNLSESERSQLAEWASKQAVIYDNIKTFPEGFETLVGERGITLSGGQKQRISIARALVKQPKILLLDDCLSAVDTQTEDAILKNLKSLMKKSTTVIISHRATSVKDCDRIIFLEGGRIVEQGTHTELLMKKGQYSTLYYQQLKENAEQTEL